MCPEPQGSHREHLDHRCSNATEQAGINLRWEKGGLRSSHAQSHVAMDVTGAIITPKHKGLMKMAKP